METSAKMPSTSAAKSSAIRVGEHVHQVVNLGDALVRASSVFRSGGPGAGLPDGGEGSCNFPEALRVPESSGAFSDKKVPFGLVLGTLTDMECVKWARDLERLSRVQQALGVQVAARLTQRTESGRFTRLGVRGPSDMSVQSLKISAAEAYRGISLARAVLHVTENMTGVFTPRKQVVLGTAFFAGEMPQEHALMISKYVDEAAALAKNERISADQCNVGQDTVVASSRDESSDYLRQPGNRIMIKIRYKYRCRRRCSQKCRCTCP